MKNKPTVVFDRVIPEGNMTNIGVSSGESIYWIGDQTINTMGMITVFFWDRKDSYSSASQAMINTDIVKRSEDNLEKYRGPV